MDSTATRAQDGRSGGAGLPDLNAETHPFETVFGLLERAAHLHLYVSPRDGPGGSAGSEGLEIAGDLHRFEAEVRVGGGTVVADQGIGERVGSITSRWLVTDTGWDPSREPAGGPLDPERPQSLVLQEDRVRFTSDVGFDGYGVGATRPVTAAGRKLLLVSGVGSVARGIGKLEGLAGTYVLDGVLEPGRGFRGVVMARLLDPERRLHGEDPVPSRRPGGIAESDCTYLVLHGQKSGADQHTEWRFGPDGRPRGILTPAHVSSASYRIRPGGARRLQTEKRVGERVGRLEATISADLTASPGTHHAPVPFGTHNVYTFESSTGETVGRIEATVEVGQSFGLTFPGLPGQAGLRFGGFGPITGGSGVFEGVQGTVTVNSAIGIAPHALSLVNTLRLVDPDERFRGSGG